MDLRDSDRLGTRLLALDLRHAEMDSRVREARLKVLRLESHLEDARLAQLIGDESRSEQDETELDPDAIAPELERLRTELEHRNETLTAIASSRWQARVQYSTAKMMEQRDRRRREAGEPSDVNPA